MGHRLTKIYTRTGDEGETGLGDGSRVAKDSLRIRAMGDIDELNCALGMLLAEEIPKPMREILTDVQHDLFNLGGEICIPGSMTTATAEATRLETSLDEYNARMPPLKEFVLPGGTRAASLAHLARAICRRAERSLVALARAERVAPQSLKFLNRLSDLLFVLARSLNREAGGDVLWQPRRSRTD